MNYIGDVRTGVTLDTKFTTVSTTGAPTTLAGTPAISVYKDNSTTQSVAGVALSVDFDGVTGLHNVRVDLSADGTFYSAGSNFQIVITTGTVGGTSVVGYVVGEFSIEARSALMPTTAGRKLDVSSGGEAGLDWANVGSPTTAQGLSGTTIATSQVVASVTGAVGSVTGNVGGNVTGSVGSVVGAVGSVTGAVGSVTGNVGGNVVGSVGSVVGAVGSVTGAVGSVTGAVGSVTGNVGGSVASVVGNVGGNVVGSVASVAGNVGGNVVGSVASVAGAVGSVTGNVGGNVVGSVASVVGAVASVTGAVGSVTGNVGGNVVGSVASVAGNVGGNVVGSVASVTARVTANTDQIEGIDATTQLETAAGAALVTYDAATGADVTSAVATLGAAIAAVPTDDENADALLARNLAGGSSSGRTVTEALAPLRNRVVINGSGHITVYAEDDVTPLWTGDVTRTPGADPITAVTPS